MKLGFRALALVVGAGLFALSATTVSASVAAAAPITPRLNAHVALDGDLCDIAKITKAVRALPHLAGARCTYTPPKSDDLGCFDSGGRWIEGQLGVIVEIDAHCPRKRLDDLEDSYEQEDGSSQYANQSLDIGIWSVGYWNEQYGQGESAVESKHHILEVVDITDPYVKVGTTNGYTPQPVQLEFLGLVNLYG